MPYNCHHLLVKEASVEVKEELVEVGLVEEELVQGALVEVVLELVKYRTTDQSNCVRMHACWKD
jgi:hypothetical protein